MNGKTTFPIGRPPSANSLRVLAARLAPACVKALAAVAADANAPADARVAAAVGVLRAAAVQPTGDPTA